MTGLTRNLNPEKALIFRITHRDNLGWILDHGLHCANSRIVDPNFVPIGRENIIIKRRKRQVPVSPKGTLEDYIPFYFTPYSPMLLNIETGFGGIKRRAGEEMVIMVSSLHKVKESGIQFTFTDRHAYLRTANYYGEISALSFIDFELLQDRDFKNDPEDPEKMDRYQAEALIHRFLPIEALLGIVCYNERVEKTVKAQLGARRLSIKALAKPTWYFK